jgi:hypothetical protein
MESKELQALIRVIVREKFKLPSKHYVDVFEYSGRWYAGWIEPFEWRRFWKRRGIRRTNAQTLEGLLDEVRKKYPRMSWTSLSLAR